MTSNWPTLTEAAEDVLLELLWESTTGGTRCRPSPERRKLKALGLIYSKPPNTGGGRAIAGHGNRWLVTPFGREVGEALQRERHHEGKSFYRSQHFNVSTAERWARRRG